MSVRARNKRNILKKLENMGIYFSVMYCVLQKTHGRLSEGGDV